MDFAFVLRCVKSLDKDLGLVIESRGGSSRRYPAGDLFRRNNRRKTVVTRCLSKNPLIFLMGLVFEDAKNVNRNVSMI